jgi:hypothetical protein
VRVREPVARPLDVVAVELLLTASQAFLVGVLLYMAIGFWEDAGVGLGSQAAILALLGLGVGGTWFYWLVGGVGWPMAAANTAAGLFFLFALVMHWTMEAFEIGGAPLVLATVSAVFGVVAGVFIVGISARSSAPAPRCPRSRRPRRRSQPACRVRCRANRPSPSP